MIPVRPLVTHISHESDKFFYSQEFGSMLLFPVDVGCYQLDGVIQIDATATDRDKARLAVVPASGEVWVGRLDGLPLQVEIVEPPNEENDFRSDVRHKVFKRPVSSLHLVAALPEELARHDQRRQFATGWKIVGEEAAIEDPRYATAFADVLGRYCLLKQRTARLAVLRSYLRGFVM